MGQKIVIAGNGMVGQKFCELLVDAGKTNEFDIHVFGGEELPAYDRVHLTSFFNEFNADELIIEPSAWYKEHNIQLTLGDLVKDVNKIDKTITTEKGQVVSYDTLILATGSRAFMPPMPGIEKKGVFGYRTIDDLEKITAYAKNKKRVAVIGGGLLGLEAAKAALDLGLQTTVIEMAPRLMPRQLDKKGSNILVHAIQALGIEVLLDTPTKAMIGDETVTGIAFQDGFERDFDMVIVSAGITPNDQLARDADIMVGPRGGIVVNSKLQSSDSSIYAIGECALFEDMIYGLVAPGFDMAHVVVANLLGGDAQFTGADMSTKLKLLGLDVASLGNPFFEGETSVVEIYDNVTGVYKKLLMDRAGQKLIGAILVGDADAYGPLSLYVKGNKDLPANPQSLIIKGSSSSGFSIDSLEEDDQICSCNNVSYGTIAKAIQVDGLRTLPQVKAATKAGTSCGGCLPMVGAILKHELAQLGIEVDNSLCEHFKYTRQELLHIVKVNKVKTFSDLLQSYGSGDGCEVCKTQVAAMLSMAWNEYVLDHDQIQETNDKFFGNIQRNGTYSVIPRSLGGELTPEQLIRMGEVAKEYALYTKLTGSQRVAMFGAHLSDLPDIWEKLGEVGLESGHAYAKGLRMVKSCVGDSWCRMGMGGSVNFAIDLENRYKGMRFPHKVKGGVSGCTRECAEAMCKDFGLIATEKGWNLYFGGNGGTYPRHAELFAQDIDQETATKYVDRYLMYYVMTAEKLNRTATWVMNFDGGLEKLKEIIIEDSLGVCAELDAEVAALVKSQHDEWALTAKDPKQRAKFKHFANSDDKDPVKMMTVRGQQKPILWEKYEQPDVPLEALQGPRSFVKLGSVAMVPKDGGANFKYGHHQIAVFNFEHHGTWYATQNLCPHKREMVLSRGLLGDTKGIPKVACPMHKKAFSLEDGKCLNDEVYSIQTFKVQIHGSDLLVELPSVEDLDRLHICDPQKSCECFE